MALQTLGARRLVVALHLSSSEREPEWTLHRDFKSTSRALFGQVGGDQAKSGPWFATYCLITGQSRRIFAFRFRRYPMAGWRQSKSNFSAIPQSAYRYKSCKL